MLERMRIASLVPEHTVMSIYRSIAPMQALAQRGHTVSVEERDVIADPAALLECDVVHVSRSCNPLMLRLMRRLRQRGVAVAWDNDDERVALLQEARRVRGQDGLAAQQFFSTMRAMGQTATLVTTPSAALAALHADTSGREVRVLPNWLPPTFTRPERVMPHQGIQIGYHVMPYHADSFDALGMRETFEQLLARHAHLSIVGIGLDLRIRSRRYMHPGGIPYGDLPVQLACLDVGLAPLADTAVNEARSDVKLKEYAAAGVPWLASPIGPYAELGEEQGGRLVEDGDWAGAIEALMNDADARRVLGQRGLRWAAAERIEEHVDVWERTLEEAIEQARAPVAR